MRAKEGRIAIVTPYYQRAPGILRRAASSVFRQEGMEGAFSVEWIIVDDGSPVAAEGELPPILPSWLKISVIRQANQGAAHARNKALDTVSGRSDFVAFLDSDDEWRDGHLRAACHALSLTGGFFFGDHIFVGKERSFFASVSFGVDEYRALQGSDSVFIFEGDFQDLVLRRNPVGTSTVVIDGKIARSVRFLSELSRAGEDRMYWLEAGRIASAIFFRTAVCARYGKGVNIYSSGLDWGGRYTSERAYNDLTYCVYLLMNVELTNDQRMFFEQRALELERESFQNVMHGLRRGRLAESGILARLILRRPRAILRLFMPAKK